MSYTIEDLEQIMHDGMAEVECTNADCGEWATVEPDADYACYRCGEGKLTSPLVTEGLI